MVMEESREGKKRVRVDGKEKDRKGGKIVKIK